MDTIGYIPIAGTKQWDAGWVVRDDDPFTVFMRSEGFTPVRSGTGLPFRWSTSLVVSRMRSWIAGMDALCYFLESVPYRDRNLICVSHGGQLALLAALRGFQIRSLTTIGTPIRSDVDAVGAQRSIGFHQHIYDQQRDFWATIKRPLNLGSLGDGSWGLERRFLIPGVQNHGIKHIGHDGIVTDPRHFSLWKSRGLLTCIRTEPKEKSRHDGVTITTCSSTSGAGR